MISARSSSEISARRYPRSSKTTRTSLSRSVLPSSHVPPLHLCSCALTLCPPQIRDNIAIGDPSAADNDEHVRLAARLGGAEDFIEKLPDGFDTYLDRPVRDLYAGMPEGTTTLFGRKVDYSALRLAGGMKPSETCALSGGQMQRLAV